MPNSAVPEPDGRLQKKRAQGFTGVAKYWLFFANAGPADDPVPNGAMDALRLFVANVEPNDGPPRFADHPIVVAAAAAFELRLRGKEMETQTNDRAKNNQARDRKQHWIS